VTTLTLGLMTGTALRSGVFHAVSAQPGVNDEQCHYSFHSCILASDTYGRRWRAGDVVGVLLDSDLQEMRFYLNGIVIHS